LADAKGEALAVLDQWTKAFAASDVDAIVKLYAPDALFMGTGSKTVVTDPAAIRKYFEGAILTRRPGTD
jgi:ketosteroid isomerase-like protein